MTQQNPFESRRDSTGARVRVVNSYKKHDCWPRSGHKKVSSLRDENWGLGDLDQGWPGGPGDPWLINVVPPGQREFRGPPVRYTKIHLNPGGIPRNAEFAPSICEKPQLMDGIRATNTCHPSGMKNRVLGTVASGRPAGRATTG